MPRNHWTEDRKKRMLDEQLARLGHPALASVVERNIASIAKNKREAEESRGFQDRVADRLTRLSGNVAFVYAHAGLLAVWLVGNSGLLGNEPFDPYPYGLLTLALSIEAIFLTTIVLISENRQAQLADRRADLDLQINLLAEYEITRILQLSGAIAQRLGIDCEDVPELDELVNDVEPEAILKELANNEEAAAVQAVAEAPKTQGPREEASSAAPAEGVRPGPVPNGA